MGKDWYTFFFLEADTYRLGHATPSAIAPGERYTVLRVDTVTVFTAFTTLLFISLFYMRFYMRCSCTTDNLPAQSLTPFRRALDLFRIRSRSAGFSGFSFF